MRLRYALGTLQGYQLWDVLKFGLRTPWGNADPRFGPVARHEVSIQSFWMFALSHQKSDKKFCLWPGSWKISLIWVRPNSFFYSSKVVVLYLFLVVCVFIWKNCDRFWLSFWVILCCILLKGLEVRVLPTFCWAAKFWFRFVLNLTIAYIQALAFS